MSLFAKFFLPMLCNDSIRVIFLPAKFFTVRHLLRPLSLFLVNGFCVEVEAIGDRLLH